MNATLPALKIALVPVLIAGVTLAGRRFGPRLAGALASFPIVGGPILLFLALEQGPAFGADAARATLLGTPAFIAFCLAYAWASRASGWPASLLLGLAAFGAGAFLLSLVPAGLAGAAAIALAATLAAPPLFPRPAPLPPGGRLPRGEIPVRMAAAAALVAGVTALAGSIGPRWSGLLVPFPVATSVLAVFSQRAQGRAFTSRLLLGTVLGLYAYVAFFVVLALALIPLGIGPAFACALAAALAAQGAVLAILPRDAAPVLPPDGESPKLPAP